MDTTATQRWLIIPDSHTPYHNRMALEDLIIGQVLPAFKWHGIIILGDFFDCYSISQYSKNPQRINNLEQELESGFELLSLFESWDFQQRIFIEGNHETRLQRYLKEHAPPLYDSMMKYWESHFTGKWDYVPYMEDIKLGELYITHDVGHSGALSTRQTLHAYQDNVIIGHNHNMLYVVEGNAKGTAHVGASFGWLGDVSKIDYRHKMKANRDWTTGFGTAHLEPETGYVYLSPHPIINNTCLVEGRHFRVQWKG